MKRIQAGLCILGMLVVYGSSTQASEGTPPSSHAEWIKKNVVASANSADMNTLGSLLEALGFEATSTAKLEEGEKQNIALVMMTLLERNAFAHAEYVLDRISRITNAANDDSGKRLVQYYRERLAKQRKAMPVVPSARGSGGVTLIDALPKIGDNQAALTTLLDTMRLVQERVPFTAEQVQAIHLMFDYYITQNKSALAELVLGRLYFDPAHVNDFQAKYKQLSALSKQHAAQPARTPQPAVVPVPAVQQPAIAPAVVASAATAATYAGAPIVRRAPAHGGRKPRGAVRGRGAQVSRAPRRSVSTVSRRSLAGRRTRGAVAGTGRPQARAQKRSVVVVKGGPQPRRPIKRGKVTRYYTTRTVQ